MGNTSQVFGIR